ncbi:hypothetical protein [Erwinia sp. MMLR14_017]
MPSASTSASRSPRCTECPVSPYCDYYRDKAA